MASHIEPARRVLRVFVSYGHDEYEALAERLARDLEQRGHSVWFDRTRLRYGREFDDAIEEGIEWVAQEPENGTIVLLMTPHSVRRPNGYCLNEVALAMHLQLRIIPAMLVYVPPPLSIFRVQWLDLRDCIPLEEHLACYERKLPVILAALEDDVLDTDGTQTTLIRALQPLYDVADIRHHLPRFTGREWLFRKIDDWLADPDGASVFWLCGGPGTGKSAIAARLIDRHPQVVAFHVCKFSNQMKANPRCAVRSIAYQLASQLPDYAARLSRTANLEEACEKQDAATLFELLIAEPLQSLGAPDQTMAVVIDALDEATHDGQNELAVLLARVTDQLPSWVRLIVTSRPEIEVTRSLESLDRVVLKSGSAKNKEDIEKYIDTYIAPFARAGTFSKEMVATILDASEENWLYLDWLRHELERGRASLSRPQEFPRGLGGVYWELFRRRMPDLEAYSRIYRPLLELVVAAREPPLLDDVTPILTWSSYQREDALRKIGSILVRDDSRVRLFHRSARDWLVDPARASDYMVDVDAGNRAFADSGWVEYSSQGVAGMSDYMRRWLPEHLQAAGDRDHLTECVTDAAFIGAAFRDGRHLDLARFWVESDTPQFRRACDESYRRLESAGEATNSLLSSARGIGQLFQHCGDFDRAIVYFERALSLSQLSDDHTTVGFAHLDIAWCLRHEEDFERALEHVEYAIGDFRASENSGGQGRAESIKGICLWHLGQDCAALQHLQLACRLAVDAGDGRTEAEALNHMGIVLRGIGQYERALRCLHRAEGFYSKMQDRDALGRCYNSLGTAYWWAGDHDRALRYYEDAERLNQITHQNYVRGLTANNLGYLYLELGDYRAARDAFARALSIRRRLRTRAYELMDLSGLALANYRLGEKEAARRLSSQAMEGLEDVAGVEDMVRAYWNHYTIARDGTQAEAESALIALSRARGLVADRLRTLTEPRARSSFVARVPLIRELTRL